MSPTPITPPLIRFIQKIAVSGNGCWIWTGHIERNGYGRFRDGENRRTLAHRFAYEALVGPIADGLQIDHLCRTPACVNPQHLEPVTPRENLLRGDTLSARNAAKTACDHGHAFSIANTYIDKLGHRRCRACHVEREHRYRVRCRARGVAK